MRWRSERKLGPNETHVHPSKWSNKKRLRFRLLYPTQGSTNGTDGTPGYGWCTRVTSQLCRHRPIISSARVKNTWFWDYFTDLNDLNRWHRVSIFYFLKNNITSILRVSERWLRVSCNTPTTQPLHQDVTHMFKTEWVSKSRIRHYPKPVLSNHKGVQFWKGRWRNNTTDTLDVKNTSCRPQR